MNLDINEKIEMERLETGTVLDDDNTFYATALKTVTLPNGYGTLEMEIAIQLI